jgi:thymidylate kinase
MFLIVEGPDSSGKSGLIEMISRERQIEVLHTGGPQDEESLFKMMEYILTLDKIIIDRLPIVSEMVYGTVLRGYSKFSPSDFNHYFNLLEKKDPVYIYCRPPRKTIHEMRELREENKPWKSKEHIEQVAQNLDKIIDKYDELMKFIWENTPVVSVYNFKENVKIEELSLINLKLESMIKHVRY